jgi:hypothetical protein
MVCEANFLLFCYIGLIVRLLTATDFDLAVELGSGQASTLGLPILNRTEIPICGVTGFTRACTRSGMRIPNQAPARTSLTSLTGVLTLLTLEN